MQFRTAISMSMGAALLTACTLDTNLPQDTFANEAVERGQIVYAKECSQCHGAAGEGAGPASLGLGVVPPELVGLSAGNAGIFPRTYVRQYVLGLTEENDLAGPMPDFARVGLHHVHPKGGADGEVLETDFESLLDYLEAIQE
ncbi:c-type cytochrome [Sulfitobacter aestuariivivens]|uniref:C-type cytochrome n=1 Tax=Sulfitobacter aestuariivivens TaxID=2766981 RepID=A0A927D914_9RHOB|nr:c-type cytochrome [Sulfitobacter aestuariivivens]MBD3665427.1 c-type cytochrome [Sulfitobacter aestuariivivens]